MKRKPTPVQFVIKFFGGVRAAARALNRNPSAVVRWKKPVNKGSTPGALPRAVREFILKNAKKKKWAITSTDLDF